MSVKAIAGAALLIVLASLGGCARSAAAGTPVAHPAWIALTDDDRDIMLEAALREVLVGVPHGSACIVGVASDAGETAIPERIVARVLDLGIRLLPPTALMPRDERTDDRVRDRAGNATTYWFVGKPEPQEDGSYTVRCGAVRGGLDGGGPILRFRRALDRWSVDRSGFWES